MTPSAFKDTLTLTMPVAAVERALRTTIGAYHHSERRELRLLRCSSSGGYSLPASIAPDVRMVGDLVQFPAPRPRLPPSPMVVEEEEAADPITAAATVGKGDWPNACTTNKCQGLVTPIVLAHRYQFEANDTSPMGGSMSVAEFQICLLYTSPSPRDRG